VGLKRGFSLDEPTTIHDVEFGELGGDEDRMSPSGILTENLYKFLYYVFLIISIF
jgi:hypothetical protein